MALSDGALDSIVTRVEAYIGEFLGTRQQLMDAQSKLLSMQSAAGSSGTATVGSMTYTVAQIQNLLAENATLLQRNADISAQISNFKDNVAAVQSGAATTMDELMGNVDPEYPWFDMPGLMGGGGSLGVLPAVAVPAAYLVGVGAVLATTVYLFIQNTKKHVAAVAGDVGSNLLLYGGGAILFYLYAKNRRWI